MEKEELIKELQYYNNKIERVDSLKELLLDSRLKWAHKNRTNFKNIFPIRNKIYKVIDKSVFDCTYNKLEDDHYYFKVLNTKFVPKADFERYERSQMFPTVKGELLDCNLKVVNGYLYERICIFNLEEIGSSDLTFGQNKPTKIYLMLDKNTGYYKIGRSNNPRVREKTLQSEKPTVELLHSWDGVVGHEKKIHNMFSENRVRGEWFDLKGSDIETIKSQFIQTL